MLGQPYKALNIKHSIFKYRVYFFSDALSPSMFELSYYCKNVSSIKHNKVELKLNDLTQ